MRITEQMFRILKLHLEGKSPYKIAREIGADPPTVYVSLKAAIANFQKADQMLTELKALGWPIKLTEVREQLRRRSPRNKEPAREVAIKLG